MSSSRTLFAALCLLVLAGPVHPQQIEGKDYSQWKADLSNSDPKVRAKAVTIMPRFGRRSEDAVPKLANMIRNEPDAVVRLKALAMLQTINIRAIDRPRVVDALGYCVAHDDQNVIRYEAASALARFGSEARLVIPQLVEGLGNRSTFDVRDACIRALIEVGTDEKKGPDPRVTDALLARLDPMKEPANSVRLRAVIALGALGQPHDPNKLADAIAALKAERYQNSPDKAIRIWSRASLMMLENQINEPDLKSIADYLADEDREIRAQAVTALGALGEKAHGRLPDILGLLRHEKEGEVLGAASRALARIGAANDKVLETIEKDLELKGLDERSKDALRKRFLELRRVQEKVMIELRQVLERKDLDERDKDAVRRIIEKKKAPESDIKPKPRSRYK